jgi:hypothetical protein
VFTAAVIELLIKRIWYRSLARIEKISFRGASPDTSTASSSPATRLPQEVVDIIVAYLIYDTSSLPTCSNISRPWYIAAAPHLHPTLFIRTDWGYRARKTDWPKPLRMASKFGFLPFVTTLMISGGGGFSNGKFSSKQFHYWTRREFSTLTNVRELTIDNLDVPSFMPRIQRYFGQFSPTLRSLTLKEPKGSHRQIVFFIGLFPHLEDLNLRYDWAHFSEKSADDLTLVPPFVPPLRGRLVVTNSGENGLVETMINLFGGVRFRHMGLFGMHGIQRLLYACANTLETLQLNADDICGEKCSSKGMRVPANDFTGGYSHRDLNLSRNKSLWKIEITAQSLIRSLRNRPPAATPSSFRAMLSTVKSPAFLDVVIVYREGDFYHDVYSKNAQAELGEEDTWYHRQFEVYREMYKARDFRLVLWAPCVGDDSVRELQRAVAAEQAKGGLPQLSMSYTLRAR